MKEYRIEGRVRPESQVRAVDGNAWTTAKDDPVLSPLFEAPAAPLNVVGGTVANGGTVVQVTNKIEAPAILDEGLTPKSPGIALLLSLLIPGVGQMYNGHVAKGILMLIGSIVLWLFFLGWIIWIWSIIDAYQSAKAISQRYADSRVARRRG